MRPLSGSSQKPPALSVSTSANNTVSFCVAAVLACRLLSKSETL